MRIIRRFKFKEGNLSFFADKNDILIKNIFGTLEDIKIFRWGYKIKFRK